MCNFKGLFQWHSTQLQTQTRSASTRCATSRGCLNDIQHNYKPKQEVPPQDAQLQGVIKDECKINQKSLQGQVRNFQVHRDKASKATNGKRCATTS
jgi:hypothetical protein